jgi:hypothetical protein
MDAPTRVLRGFAFMVWVRRQFFFKEEMNCSSSSVLCLQKLKIDEEEMK